MIPLGCHFSIQPSWCQGANLFRVNELRIIKLLSSTAVWFFVCVGWGFFSVVVLCGDVLLSSSPVLASAVLWAFTCMYERSNAILPSDYSRLFLLVTGF